MRKIYKYPLACIAVQEVPIKGLVKLLTVQVQRWEPQLWAIVDTNDDAPVTRVVLLTVGTGHALPANLGAHLGTYQLEGGALVFHVFSTAE